MCEHGCIYSERSRCPGEGKQVCLLSFIESQDVVLPLTFVRKNEGTVVTQGKSISDLRPGCTPALVLIARNAQSELKGIGTFLRCKSLPIQVLTRPDPA